MLAPSIFENSFMNDFFEGMFRTPFDMMRNVQIPGMKADVQEFDDKYQMDIELPGFTREEIHADLENGYLTIQAEHSENKEEKNEKDGTYIRRERYSGKYQRSFYVGDEMTQEDIKANFRDGVLKLEIPKKEPVAEVEKKQRIAIEG
ncbi:MAG: Hsp20/alpha crystallin family protein [Lachnospiraceae bacterium]|nr:Hsp20/alpha crystallin family protein [Lachnospiraceae bacterium]MDD7378596.1 Hsp20/alpha crystallin family protein [Lachnospiraceae bacterium]MDY4617657.1 Hsp20/alpha crystallin family protein [Lachnospiraceae bacterium]